MRLGFCDGQLLPISSNSSLFSLIGTNYGGDGRTTFALPDLRGRVAVGAGSGPGLSSYQLGQSGGLESVTLSTNEILSHNHNLGNVQVTTDLPFSTAEGENSTHSSGSILPKVPKFILPRVPR